MEQRLYLKTLLVGTEVHMVYNCDWDGHEWSRIYPGRALDLYFQQDHDGRGVLHVNIAEEDAPNPGLFKDHPDVGYKFKEAFGAIVESR
jgi:hypothetical protein